MEVLVRFAVKLCRFMCDSGRISSVTIHTHAVFIGIQAIEV